MSLKILLLLPLPGLLPGCGTESPPTPPVKNNSILVESDADDQGIWAEGIQVEGLDGASGDAGPGASDPVSDPEPEPEPDPPAPEPTPPADPVSDPDPEPEPDPPAREPTPPADPVSDPDPEPEPDPPAPEPTPPAPDTVSVPPLPQDDASPETTAPWAGSWVTSFGDLTASLTFPWSKGLCSRGDRMETYTEFVLTWSTGEVERGGADLICADGSLNLYFVAGRLLHGKVQRSKGTMTWEGAPMDGGWFGTAFLWERPVGEAE